jgi:hypothetical protein
MFNLNQRRKRDAALKEKRQTTEQQKTLQSFHGFFSALVYRPGDHIATADAASVDGLRLQHSYMYMLRGNFKVQAPNRGSIRPRGRLRLGGARTFLSAARFSSDKTPGSFQKR